MRSASARSVSARRPNRPPRHARFDLLMVLRWSNRFRWGLLVAVAVVGAATAFVRGSSWGSSTAVPPPSTDAIGWVQTDDASNVADANGYAAQALPGTTSPPTSTAPGAGVPIDSQALGLAADGIPQTALLAYQEAAAREASLRPSCHLPWQLLAGIGRVESDHGRFDNATLYADGLSVPPVIGPALNGDGTALILDTDDGRLDGDTVYDHAVGPMQFIPSTWARYGVDGNGDGKADPFNIFDAAVAAADYLCVAGGDLATTSGQIRAIEAYNHSMDYVRLVMSVEAVYAGGTVLTTGPAGPNPPPPTVPPVDPGHPRVPSSPPSSSPPSPSGSGPSGSSGSPGSPPGSSDSSDQPAGPGSSSSSDAPATCSSSDPGSGEPNGSPSTSGDSNGSRSTSSDSTSSDSTSGDSNSTSDLDAPTDSGSTDLDPPAPGDSSGSVQCPSLTLSDTPSNGPAAHQPTLSPPTQPID